MERSKDFCLVVNADRSADQCAAMLMDMPSVNLARCKDECPRGQALAGQVSIPRTAQATNPAPRSAWDIIAERTGCESQVKLAKKIGGTYQSKISQIMVKLSKGIIPTGHVWERLLEISSLTPEELLFAATGKATPANSSPATPPAASSPPQPSGTDAPSSSVPDGPAETEGEALSEGADVLGDGSLAAFDAAAESMGYLTPMGADPADVLMTSQELDKLGIAIPADFEPFIGAPVPTATAPCLSILKSGEISLGAAAVRAFGLAEVQAVRLFWSPKRNQVGILPGTGPGQRKLQTVRKGCLNRCITAREFLRLHGLPVSGSVPVERHPSGLLVATINTQPAQPGKEA